MTFKTQLAQDAINCILNTNEFAESITYTPKNGSPKSIKALVVRNRLDTTGQDQGRTLHNQAEIYIVNDATNGVTSIDKGDDTVSLPEIIGGSAISWVVIEILGMDEGLWHLLIEK